MENFNEILNSNQEEEPPLFLDFPSPFFDGISTTPIHTTTILPYPNDAYPDKPINTTEPFLSESKRLKKRSVNKKDRHSKIHTAQGLRDRRMRLSLHIARKFFDLQDLLGFDKASKTIEWLFSKSNKAIKEVAENYSPQHTNQSMSEVGLITSEIKTTNIDPENSKEEEMIKNTKSRKQIRNNSSVRETRDQARARARDRTRERLMIKELEKSKELFRGNPKEEIYKLGLGYLTNPNNHNAEELGFFPSSPSESSSLEHSCTHLLQDQPQSGTINLNSFENYSGNCSKLINHNPPAGFLLGEWDADNFVNEYYNYGILPNTVSLTGDVYEQNPSLFLMSSTTNILHVQSQNQGK
ncbi:hypothetical protein L1987_79217 [Smallanthus sonchifolius]|uniref:Uncharacterized protein n=2 Tax=Smallanthus sonchifolius TaxID=185202 RepID=A0ACB8ZJA0_9ASTR|nr:hypothetical protein L1987_79215 [Smallanthus sonchifolius]KAI3696207.1 hypothetical protein L1987_79217 [Smallanthus sonchifolius]